MVSFLHQLSFQVLFKNKSNSLKRFNTFIHLTVGICVICRIDDLIQFINYFPSVYNIFLTNNI